LDVLKRAAYPHNTINDKDFLVRNFGLRFGFNGKEMDNEVLGGGNTYDYGFRIYNPRLGKFLSVDPLTKMYPSWTSYHFAQNRPIKAIDLDGLEAWDGPNDVKDVMSLNSYQQFAKAQLNILTSSQSSKKFDCADLAFYLMAKYFEYMKVDLDLKIGNKTITSGDKKYSSFDDFYEEAKLLVGSNYITSDLSFRIKRSEAKNGDLFTIPGHIMLNNPQGTEIGKQVTIAESSGSDFGPDNPNTETKAPWNTTFNSLSGADTRRFNFLKDLPAQQEIKTISSMAIKPLSVNIALPELKQQATPTKVTNEKN